MRLYCEVYRVRNVDLPYRNARDVDLQARKGTLSEFSGEISATRMSGFLEIFKRNNPQRLNIQQKSLIIKANVSEILISDTTALSEFLEIFYGAIMQMYRA